MGETAIKEFKDAIAEAEARAKESVQKREFAKAAEHFDLAAGMFRKLSAHVKGKEARQKIQHAVEKLQGAAQQCLAAARKQASKPKENGSSSRTGKLKKREKPVPQPDTPPPVEDELAPAEVAAPEPEPAPVGKPAPLRPKLGKKGRLGLPGKGSRGLPVKPVAPKTAVPAKLTAPPPKLVVKAPPAVQDEANLGDAGFSASEKTAPDTSDITLHEVEEVPADIPDIPDATDTAPPPAPEPVAAVSPDAITEPLLDAAAPAEAPVQLRAADSLRSKAVSGVPDRRPPARPGSVVISLDAGDFPTESADPSRFTIQLSPQFLEHLCGALVAGDLAQIANKFSKLADNLMRKALAGDRRDELELRFTAQVCREVADRLLSRPLGSPVAELEVARSAYRTGDYRSAATLYKQAAMRLLDGEPAQSEQEISLHERQASEYLSFSSRLRSVSGSGDSQG
ncbi:MAG: hypothetical protein IT463_08500 [Planctomycetes bacterium]|nr:hypothetical protein [Planctomycetota bacterium]